MSLAPRLDLRQTQSLVMTPQLQQAIKLLALSNLEIEAFIAEEIEKNPLLESPKSLIGGDEEGSRPAQPEAPETRGEVDGLVSGAADPHEPGLDLDYATESHQSDSLADGGGGQDGSLGLNGISASGGLAGDTAPDLDAFAAADLSLTDHLLAQAGTAFGDGDMFIARALIDAIDEAGYLRADLTEIANRLGVARVRVEGVLKTVQTFDPTGVGARDLAECIALQAREADRYDPCMARLIDHLDLLARGDLTRLKRLCQVDDEDMADMIRELRGYDPKPGCRYGGEAAPAVVPDLFVTRTKAGWSIEINSATLPRVLVNRRYLNELTSGPQDKASKAWVTDALASANWLVKALDQRQRTIIRVATELVRQQEAFFLHGVSHLRPLTLSRIAEAIEMHESTVSRVTSNKYLSCARGLFELKYFFTSAIQSADGGEAVSAEAVKNAIRGLIANEGTKVLSDDTLVELLQKQGFDIARRTVAKYREAIGLGSSVQRRRVKALGG
ncbi:RNA polymerase factor sigma-54 [Sphingomonas aerophila]|jgi:RNA polymerase sigma-54 factor|uniref:RNA polymerase sigma-54 factor n=1 Tax=Sphingomonas aerophila TaxID=1344948 RepID=A0A7W9B9Z3_9SPHN|nr:RNA polymerase factor sigma-54 [Sphingomonas aerophila]MBB5713357.1 RNA polymerase sigma-54 factor [Sphingomonas aerophila]